ncbi:hypothetical protein CLV42_102398 [Chitinophaga ginsengisoli]|uniref:Uncharacterized protein n=1 Tax=Chitinophaga ginsengisoli TaxID=363837 RepID=A0A2P8GLK9_9BACT|nr:hypothetical protein CLV42_102398 [Chitinophaga ginsengisoli]
MFTLLITLFFVVVIAVAYLVFQAGPKTRDEGNKN